MKLSFNEGVDVMRRDGWHEVDDDGVRFVKPYLYMPFAVVPRMNDRRRLLLNPSTMDNLYFFLGVASAMGYDRYRITYRSIHSEMMDDWVAYIELGRISHPSTLTFENQARRTYLRKLALQALALCGARCRMWHAVKALTPPCRRQQVFDKLDRLLSADGSLDTECKAVFDDLPKDARSLVIFKETLVLLDRAGHAVAIGPDALLTETAR